MKSLFPDVVSTAIPESRDFYVALFGMRPIFSTDWYVQLEHPDNTDLQIAFIHADHESVLKSLRTTAQGVFITIETDDVDALYEKAKTQGHKILVEVKDEEWGQRHFVTVDPNGLPVDVFTLIPPTGEYAQ